MRGVSETALGVREDKGCIQAVAQNDRLVARADYRQCSYKGFEEWDAGQGDVSRGDDIFHVLAFRETYGENDGGIRHHDAVFPVKIVTVAGSEQDLARVALEMMSNG